MEVRIKQGEKMIDATIEMVDGVMVVSPKEVFEPKNGDVIVCSNHCGYWTLIVKRIEANKVYHHAVLIDNGILRINDFSLYSEPRPATEEEKKLLFDRLAEEGYSLDAERKELVKLKWKPKEGEDVFIPKFIIENGFGFYFEPQKQTMRNELQIYLNKGMCFKTKEECKSFCGELNRVINSVES